MNTITIEPPVCFTCGKELSWNTYRQKLKEYKTESNDYEFVSINTIKKSARAKIFDEFRLKRYCCKRMYIGHE